MSLAAADAERVLSKYTPEPNTGCWLWTGGLNSKGYGQVWVNGRTRPAHRVIYQITRGPIGTGLELDHRCRPYFALRRDPPTPILPPSPNPHAQIRRTTE